MKPALFWLVAQGTALGVACLLQALGLGAPSEVLVLSIGVVVVAARFGLVPGAGASVVAVLMFNVFFTEPFYTLLVDDPRNYLVFALLLVLGTLVGSLTDTLKARTREAQASLFLQGISHDWKTPLAVMAGTAATLKDTAAQRLTPDERARLETIEREARALGRQVETSLALVELEGAPPKTLAWIPAEEVLHSCQDRFAEWHPERTVRLEPSVGLPLVKIEPSLMERALLNLLENADAASPAGLPIEMALAVAPGELEFQVFDRGPGLPAAKKELLATRGAGFGLALVRATARFHGGQAGVSDRAGGGSVFWIRIPIPSGAPTGEVPE